jgi:hypothetical protein
MTTGSDGKPVVPIPTPDAREAALLKSLAPKTPVAIPDPEESLSRFLKKAVKPPGEGSTADAGSALSIPPPSDRIPPTQPARPATRSPGFDR